MKLPKTRTSNSFGRKLGAQAAAVAGAGDVKASYSLMQSNCRTACKGDPECLKRCPR